MDRVADLVERAEVNGEITISLYVDDQGAVGRAHDNVPAHRRVWFRQEDLCTRTGGIGYHAAKTTNRILTHYVFNLYRPHTPVIKPTDYPMKVLKMMCNLAWRSGLHSIHSRLKEDIAKLEGKTTERLLPLPKPPPDWSYRSSFLLYASGAPRRFYYREANYHRKREREEQKVWRGS
jgi:hypothetical protein